MFWQEPNIDDNKMYIEANWDDTKIMTQLDATTEFQQEVNHTYGCGSKR